MSKLPARIVIGTFLAAVLGVGLVQRLAYADKDIDCSNLKKWDSDKTYKKGDLVWIREGGMNEGAEWKCTQDQCRGAGEQPHYNGSKGWTVVASCSKRPN